MKKTSVLNFLKITMN